LRNIGQKDFEAVVQRGVVVLVFIEAGAKLRDDFVGALEIFGSFGAACWAAGLSETGA
jgi:hypothetical protein